MEKLDQKEQSLELYFSTHIKKAVLFPCRNLLKLNNFIRICSFRKTGSGKQL